MEPVSLLPNVAMARRFLNMLDPRGTFTFQTFDDSKDRKDFRLARVLHGTLDEHASALELLQRRGAGVFVMVNEGDGIAHPPRKTCRDSASVVAVRALWADLDGSPLEPILKCDQPDIIVESSTGRWHTYWLTSDCTMQDFGRRQLQIAHKFNGDKSVHDLPRVMRLPGFWHQKATPVMTRLVYPEGTQ